jgi:hypothetical protein
MPVALLAIFGGLTASQWMTLISLLPVVIKIIGAFSGAAAELFEKVVADIRANMKETGKGHKAVTTKMITEGYAVPGCDDVGRYLKSEKPLALFTTLRPFGLRFAVECENAPWYRINPSRCHRHSHNRTARGLLRPAHAPARAFPLSATSIVICFARPWRVPVLEALAPLQPFLEGHLKFPTRGAISLVEQRRVGGVADDA